MNPPTKVLSKLYNDKKYYQNHQPKTVTTQQYQKSHHLQKHHEYQQKKKSTFTDHNYSSSWNPLYKKRERIDAPYKELNQRKCRVPQMSDWKSDPFAFKPATYKKQKPHLSTSRKEYHPSAQYKVEHERKYILPTDRQLSKPNITYHAQTGMTSQLTDIGNWKDKTKHLRNNSSMMRQSMDYAVNESSRSLERVNAREW